MSFNHRASSRVVSALQSVAEAASSHRKADGRAEKPQGFLPARVAFPVTPPWQRLLIFLPHTPGSPAGTQLGPGKAGQGGEVDKGQHRCQRAQVTAACPLGLGVTCCASQLPVQKTRSSTLQSRRRVPGAPVGVREPQGGVPGTQLAWPCELGVTMERGRKGGDPDPKRVCRPWEPPFSDPETTPPPALCPAVCCTPPRPSPLTPPTSGAILSLEDETQLHPAQM